MEQPEKKEYTKNEVLKYLGKSLKKHSPVDSEKQWKMFKLDFDVQMDYPFTLTSFDSLGTKEDSKSLTLKELEEGENYYVVYKVVENAFESHGKWHENRTIMFMGTPDEGVEPRTGKPKVDNDGDVSVDKKETVSVPEPVNEGEVKTFFKEYLEKGMDEQGSKDWKQFVLVYFRNAHTDEFELAKNVYNNHKKEGEEEVKEEGGE